MNPETHTNGRTADAVPGRVSTASGPRTGLILAVAAGGLVLLLGGGFAAAYSVRHRGEAAAQHDASAFSGTRPAVDVVQVQPTANSYPLTLPGQTAGWYQSTIYARVDGYIGQWTADIGDPVKQGQVLATIDTPELDQQLAAAKAKADASDAMVEVAQSNESIAKLTYDRWRDSPKGVVSDQEREEKQANYAAAKAQLTEARAQAQLDRADVARYAALETFRDVRAPYDGVITSRKVDVGDLVTMGSSSNTSPLYSVAQSKVIRVFVDVPQKAAAELVVGTPARATTDQRPGEGFTGTVARTAMSVDPQTRTERVEVDVPNPGLTLVPGMYVEVTFDLAQHGLLQVPAAAILFKPAGLQVAVVAPDGRVDFRPVTVAKDDGDVVELSTGVHDGDRVALNISSAVAQGDLVDAVDDEKDHAIPTTEPAPTAAEPKSHI